MITDFVNCTPHDVVIVDDQGLEILRLPKCENPPRLKQSTRRIDAVNGIPISETVFGETENLPMKLPGTSFIVSRLVMSANPNRSDLLVPNETVRNEKGHVIGCRSLARN